MSRINFLPIIINLIPQRKPGASEIDALGWLATGELKTFEEIVGYYHCREIGILQHYLQPENIYDLAEELTLFHTNLHMSTTYVNKEITEIYSIDEYAIHDDLYKINMISSTNHVNVDTVDSTIVPSSPNFIGQSSDSV